jgi:hypothetical protein
VKKNNIEQDNSVGKMLKFDLEGADYRLIFEDNGRVAYAYLYKGSEIIGDVWLYNVCPAPLEPEWKDRSKIPFANPKTFISNRIIKPVSSQNELTVVWEKDENDNLLIVLIYLRDELFAGIAPGSKPGWSKLSIKNGPLSKVMPESMLN